MTEIYRLNFWFEWQVDTPFWAANDSARKQFGIGPIELEVLPLSAETMAQAREIAAWHDGSLNWSYPPYPGPWPQEECDRFNKAERQLYYAVVHELGDDFEVINTQAEINEDPDLDEYLRDPKNFKRE